MRFFSDDFYWQIDDVDSDFEQVGLAWKAVQLAYLDSIRSNSALRRDVRSVAEPFTVDDCLLSMARADLKKKSLMLCLRCGNSPSGYFDLILHYKKVQFKDELLEGLVQIARQTTSRRFSHDGWIHEFDAGPGWLSHEIAFHYPWPADIEESGPKRLRIVCGSATARTEPRKNRKLAPFRKRFRMSHQQLGPGEFISGGSVDDGPREA